MKYTIVLLLTCWLSNIAFAANVTIPKQFQGIWLKETWVKENGCPKQEIIDGGMFDDVDGMTIEKTIKEKSITWYEGYCGLVKLKLIDSQKTLIIGKFNCGSEDIRWKSTIKLHLLLDNNILEWKDLDSKKLSIFYLCEAK